MARTTATPVPMYALLCVVHMCRGRVLPPARGVPRQALPPLRRLRGKQTRVHGRVPQLRACTPHSPPHTAHTLSSVVQTDIMEKYLEGQLLQRVPGFTMAAFQLSLQ